MGVMGIPAISTFIGGLPVIYKTVQPFIVQFFQR